nr:MAG TPA: hypothetical protein [Caudoviricetes sp.]
MAYPTVYIHPLGLRAFSMWAYTRAIGTTRKELPDEHLPR